MTTTSSATSINKAYDTFRSVREQSKASERGNAQDFTDSAIKLPVKENGAINTLALVKKDESSLQIG